MCFAVHRSLEACPVPSRAVGRMSLRGKRLKRSHLLGSVAWCVRERTFLRRIQWTLSAARWNNYPANRPLWPISGVNDPS